ncbi:Uncharacterised protein [Halioglobus japonicus]|nr:Uncharacterised protein [Halioglobus japonicus]
MSDNQRTSKSDNNDAAWASLVAHLNTVQPLPSALIRAAYLEHVAQQRSAWCALRAECLELRHTWVDAAELIKPSLADGLTPHLDGVVRDHALRSPLKPSLPRAGLWARVRDDIRRFFQ